MKSLTAEDRRRWHQKIAEALFSDGFSDVFVKIAPAIGLEDDWETDEVLTSFEEQVKCAFEPKPAPSTQAIYERLEEGDVMLIERRGDVFLVAANEDGMVRFFKHDISDMSVQGYMQDERAQLWLAESERLLKELQEAVGFLKAFMPETVEPLDKGTEEHDDVDDDIDSLDTPRLHGQ